MLTDVEFQPWCGSLRLLAERVRLQLSEQQGDLIKSIRTSPPARKVRGSGKNVHGPSPV